MIRSLPAICLVLVVLLSCNSNKKDTPLTDTDVATTFIRDILDNKIDEAGQYILMDTTNIQYFESFRQAYRKKGQPELEKYRSAEIIINEISNVTDSVSIINYSNSYMRSVKNTLKLVRINGKWLIDFKYTFSGNM